MTEPAEYGTHITDLRNAWLKLNDPSLIYDGQTVVEHDSRLSSGRRDDAPPEEARALAKVRNPPSGPVPTSGLDSHVDLLPVLDVSRHVGRRRRLPTTSDVYLPAYGWQDSGQGGSPSKCLTLCSRSPTRSIRGKASSRIAGREWWAVEKINRDCRSRPRQTAWSQPATRTNRMACHVFGGPRRLMCGCSTGLMGFAVAVCATSRRRIASLPTISSLTGAARRERFGDDCRRRHVRTASGALLVFDRSTVKQVVQSRFR